MKITTKLIKSLNPCQSRLDNYLLHYKNFKGSARQFFELEHINHSDKLWVVLRLVSHDIQVIFALEGSFAATEYSILADDAHAAYAYAGAANAAYYAYYAATNAAAANAAAAAYKQEQSRQLEALVYLIKGERK